MKLAIIINPISGKHGHLADAGASKYAQARELISRPEIEAEVVLTTAKGHGAVLAQGYVSQSYDLVIAWGGDGTVNEIAGPLIGTPTALAIVRSGSGDGLARSLGLPRDADRALHAALQGPSSASAIDVGYLGDRHFLNIAGIGFDATIATVFNQGARRGGMGYVRNGLNGVWSYEPRQYTLRLDDDARDGRYFLVAFANGREYGNGIVLAPRADPRDGWLDVITVDAGPAWKQLWRSRRLAIGRERPAEGVHRTRVRSATVSGEHLHCHVDGETFETAGTLEVTIRPKSLRVCGPVSC
jgi:diacylglycerol kinase (ATP)